MTITPDPAWETDETYDLLLKKQLFSDLGHDQDLRNDIEIPLRVANVNSAPPILDEGIIADAAFAGDILLVAARDDGLKAYDISDPANPSHLVTALDTLGAVTAVATDGFGHVFALTGRHSEHSVIRMMLLETLADGLDSIPPGDSSLSIGGLITNVTPGDLEVETIAEVRQFSPADPPSGVTVQPEQGDDWTSITISASSGLLTPHHPLILHDHISGRILYEETVNPGEDVVISNDNNLPRSQPLLLRAHKETMLYAFSLGGALITGHVLFNEPDHEDGQYVLEALDVLQNEDLRDWLRERSSDNLCREPSPVDTIYLGQLALAPRQDQRPVLLSAAHWDGLIGFTQATEPTVAPPSWVRCLRASQGYDLADVSAAEWTFAEDEDEKTTIAVTVGHRRLDVLEIDASGRPTPLTGLDIDWNPYRVALDPTSHLILVRDAGDHLAVFSLIKRTEVKHLSDITLPDGCGMGPLEIDPELGFAIAGTAPVQYKQPVIEVVVDGNGDGILERAEYLQPLGVPQGEDDEDGNPPPYLSWVAVRAVGVPEGTNKLRVNVEGLAPGGAPLALRPEPFLPSSTVIEVERTAGLPLHDPARHVFISKRPLLLIANEAAATEYWDSLDDEARDQLTEEDEEKGVYALCRNCDRDEV
ncbi:MAG: hypothetical protein GY856_17435, partial [bacterium]|nr:hypothetical protein [bacterium]